MEILRNRRSKKAKVQAEIAGQFKKDLNYR